MKIFQFFIEKIFQLGKVKKKITFMSSKQTSNNNLRVVTLKFLYIFDSFKMPVTLLKIRKTFSPPLMHFLHSFRIWIF